MKHLAFGCLAMLILGCSQPSGNEQIENGVSWELASQRKARLSKILYQLEFRIPEVDSQAIQGLETLQFELNDNSEDLLLDFREDADLIKGVVVNGKTHEINWVNEHIIISKAFLEKGQNEIEINFFAGESSLNRNPEYLYTLFVPDRARTAFPCFDQPNLKAIYELTLDVPQSWNAVANAPVRQMRMKDGRKSYQFHPSDLISTYLFSFVAGKFEAISRSVDGRQMTLYHRETDQEKVRRNVDEVFQLHADALNWLEQYTGIRHPFKKFDFALIPSFQYGGMEHVGAIQYRANSLFLDENPSQNRLLGRASLIAHETAHMWFGDLVTMDWFNDVWTKEVFANFMAAKIVNPSFPEIDHDLNFLVRHYPSAYSVDRTAGANPIRQELANLNEAGQMYGAIIYNKAPIMMRQLEMLLGEDVFREGMREYLRNYAFKNATWPDLIDILDKRTSQDLKSWSEVWVNTPGRPDFQLTVRGSENPNDVYLIQADPKDQSRRWVQKFQIGDMGYDGGGAFMDWNGSVDSLSLMSYKNTMMSANVLFNSDGRGYGLFPAFDAIITQQWSKMTDLQKGSALINLYERFLEPSMYTMKTSISADRYISLIKWILIREKNQLILNLVLGQMNRIYWSFLSDDQRNRIAPDLERTLWHCMNDLSESPSQKKLFFNAFRNVTITAVNLGRLHNIWTDASHARVPGLRLSENDYTALAGQLAVKMPERAQTIVDKQYQSIENPDRKRRFAFIRPALSNDQSERDTFFESLKDEKNRQTESWVLGALGYLHHPLRREQSEKYILPSLELLQEIQQTGDIFFPKRWLDQTLSNYNSPSAADAVNQFLERNPEYNRQLKMKIEQSADMLFRAKDVVDTNIGAKK